MVTEPGLRAPGRGAGLLTTWNEQGYQVYALQGRTATLAMVPELGGRIISLRSLRTGREWCWHQDRSDWLWANDPGDPFGSSPQAGMDECVPSVAACRVKGRAIPDHGEVWYQAWSLDAKALAEDELRAELALTVSPFVFSRSIRVGPDGAFVLDYALRNTGSEPEPFLWSSHPLLNLEAGDRLELPAEVAGLHLNGGLNGDPAAPIRMGDVWAWPEPFPGVRLDEGAVPGMPGGCVKGFAGPLTTGYAAVGNERTGDRLTFTWDPAENPFLGLWLNRGHGGFHHVALEPCNGAPDALADALKETLAGWRQHGTVPPRATVRWRLNLEIA